MINKTSLIAALAAAALAGGIWTDGKNTYPASIPIDLKKHKSIFMGCYSGGKRIEYQKPVKTKVVITQERPCLSVDGINYKKISNNTIEVIEYSYVNGSETDEYYNDGNFNDYEYALGHRGCELKGKESWIVYQVVDGDWQKVCETEFEFK